tara:strand:- start:400 stop:873 length:474 start_codon:yes stop_codon:yes gene_type:complete
MSANRKKYDKCCVKEQIDRSTKPFDLLMDPLAFEHNNACRIDVGVVGGNDVSTVGNTRHANNGELIDVDSMLKGLDKFQNDCNKQEKRNILNIGIATNLKECNIEYGYSRTQMESQTNKLCRCAAGFTCSPADATDSGKLDKDITLHKNMKYSKVNF